MMTAMVKAVHVARLAQWNESDRPSSTCILCCQQLEVSHCWC